VAFSWGWEALAFFCLVLAGKVFCHLCVCLFFSRGDYHIYLIYDSFSFVVVVVLLTYPAHTHIHTQTRPGSQ